MTAALGNYLTRFHWEREQGRYIIRDRLRGFPREGDGMRAMAVCYAPDDAQKIVDALNTVHNGAGHG